MSYLTTNAILLAFTSIIKKCGGWGEKKKTDKNPEHIYKDSFKN